MEKLILDPSTVAPELFRYVPSLQSMQSKQQEWKPLTLRTCPIPQSEEQVDNGTCYRDHLSRDAGSMMYTWTTIWTHLLILYYYNFTYFRIIDKITVKCSKNIYI